MLNLSGNVNKKLKVERKDLAWQKRLEGNHKTSSDWDQNHSWGLDSLLIKSTVFPQLRHKHKNRVEIAFHWHQKVHYFSTTDFTSKEKNTKQTTAVFKWKELSLTLKGTFPPSYFKGRGQKIKMQQMSRFRSILHKKQKLLPSCC